MPIARGKDLLLQLSDGSGGFTPVAGLRTRTVSLNAGAVDITHAESDGWRTLLEHGGVRQLNVSGNGVFLGDAALRQVRALFLSGSVARWRLSVPQDGTLEAEFLLTNLDYAGDHRGEVTYAISLASAGVVSFTEEVTP